MLSHNNGNLFHGLHVHGSSVYKTKRVQLDAPSVNVMDMTGANVSARTVEANGVLGTATTMMIEITTKLLTADSRQETGETASGASTIYTIGYGTYNTNIKSTTKYIYNRKREVD